jgi:PAS domain S-box-containing protein
MLDTDIDELERLRRTNRDLATCLALPAMWAGRDPRYIVTTLLDMLVSMLGLDLAHVIVHDAVGGVLIEEWKHDAPERFAPVVPPAPDAGDRDGDGRLVHVPGVGHVRLARARLSGTTGRAVVTVGSMRSDFPNDRDTILLRAAVNQAGIALNTARAEEVVRRSEERFRRYFELGLIGMAITSPANVIVEVNDKLCEILGYERGELLQRTWGELTHPDDLAADEANVRRVLGGELDGYSADKRFVHRDGRAVHADISVKCVRRPDGAVDHFVALVQDITGRKQAEDSLAEAARQQAALYRFVARIHRAESFGEVYDAALDAILDAVRCDRASLLLCDDAGVMRFVGWRRLSDAYRRAVEGHSAWAADEPDPQPVCVVDTASAGLEDSLKAVVLRERIRALAFIPLVVHGTLIGKFMTYYDAPHVFTEVELDLSLSIARQLAVSIQRKRAEESLRDAAEEARKRQGHAESLAAVARSLNTLELDAVLQSISTSACALLDADVATVFRLDAASGTLFLVAGGGPRGSTVNRNTSVPRGRGLVGLAVERSEAVVSTDLLTDTRILYEPEMRARIEAARHRAGLAVPLFVQGRITGALFVGRLAGQRFSDDEVKLVTAFANQAAVAMQNAELYDAAQRANRAKDEFLAMLGHELRNPLGAITGAIGVLKAFGSQEPTVERARSVIERQGQHLSRLVDDLLDVARVTTGKVRLNRRPVDLGALVGSAMSAWQAAGRFSRHEVGVEASEVWVDVDETRIEQILDNLLGNALKYTAAGGRVAVRVGHDGGTAVLEVADTGAGFPPGFGERIFELFVQGERALDRAQGGLGIGLTLVKALVGLHEGTVEAASEGPGRGSVFTIRLPRIATPRDTYPVAPPAAVKPLSRRIVIIEDNDDAREVLRLQLTLQGHEVHEAAEGQAGVELAASVDPDVVLIDVGLPGLDGYEVARRICTTREGKSMLLVALTGYGQPQDRQRALDAGFDVHLTKPVSPEQLATVIMQGAGNRRPS